jgi:ubiquitin-associated SH3 domain-containing protein
MLHELIVYACPRGPLAALVRRYYERAGECCGTDEAHRYPPHCTLTGFFRDEAASIPIYIAALDSALQSARSCQPFPVMRVLSVDFTPNWHGLQLESDWLKALVADFAVRVDSPTRADALRLKDWLHLSLAYGFAPANAAPLEALARELIDRRTPVRWELRLYEREPGDHWTEHACWPLESTRRSPHSESTNICSASDIRLPRRSGVGAVLAKPFAITPMFNRILVPLDDNTESECGLSRSRADLIGMSAYQRSALSRLVLGSVADAVAHDARLPVLLVKPNP